MARLTGDRGQMLLIGAFILAVAFVGLALIANAAIYTENIASRNDAGGAGDALQSRHAVAEGVGDAMARANVYNNSAWSHITDNVSAAADTVAVIAAREEAADGRYVDVSATGHTEGTRIADNASGGSVFRGSSGAHDWTVAETDRARAFVMTVDHDNVTGTNSFGGPLDDEFRVNVTDGTDSWIVNVTGHSGTFTVGVDPPGGDAGTCAVSGSPETVTIDLTAGTVAGRDCPAMTFREGVSAPYDVRFNRSYEVRGNYSLVIDNAGYSNPELQSGAGPGQEPYQTVAVYRSTLTFRYDGSGVRYETAVRVLPGEPE